MLTHSSFYEQEGKGNSRYVFAGMFVFKGQVADILFRYYTAEIKERDEKKEESRLLKKQQRKAEARARDAKRRKSQAEAKKRKAENAARAAAKAAKEARPMSAKKRRFLEDKMK